MIAVDTSSMIAYWSGGSGWDVEAVDHALAARQAALPPVVLIELLSDPRLSIERGDLLAELPLLEVNAGHWTRAGRLRAAASAAGRRARLADSLIAQSCLDHDVALITREADFLAFARRVGLRLASPATHIE